MLLTLPPVPPPLAHPPLEVLHEGEQAEEVVGLHLQEEEREGEGGEVVEVEDTVFRARALVRRKMLVHH